MSIIPSVLRCARRSVHDIFPHNFAVLSFISLNRIFTFRLIQKKKVATVWKLNVSHTKCSIFPPIIQLTIFVYYFVFLYLKYIYIYSYIKFLVPSFQSVFFAFYSINHCFVDSLSVFLYFLCDFFSIKCTELLITIYSRVVLLSNKIFPRYILHACAWQMYSLIQGSGSGSTPPGSANLVWCVRTFNPKSSFWVI